MPNVGGKKYDYDADGIVKARAAAIQVVQNPDKHSKKEVADAKAVIAQYAKEQDMKREGNHPSQKEKRKRNVPEAPRPRPKFMYGGMANKKKHSYSNGGSVIDNLTPAQKNMVKKMAAANKK